MPLLAPPARGYADWQRTVNWDSDVLWQADSGDTTASYTSPMMDVGRYAYLGGWVKEGLSQCQLVVTWWSAFTGGVEMGVRTWTMDVNVGPDAQWRIPNLGPFVQIQVSSLNNQTYYFTGQVIGTNRYHPLETIPENPNFDPWENTAYTANGALWTYPKDYYVGPLSCSVNPITAGFVGVEILTNAGNWLLVQGVQLAGGSGYSQVTFVTPPGAWRFYFVNTNNTAGSVTLRACPSLTGST